jgi:hypothetical protein
MSQDCGEVDLFRPVIPRGGHFAAMEQPEVLAAEIREFFRPLRGQRMTELFCLVDGAEATVSPRFYLVAISRWRLVWTTTRSVRETAIASR